MKLSFGTTINGQPNYFIEKIWKGLTSLSAHLENDYYQYLQRHIEKFDRSWDGDQYTEFLEPKIHTIRKDTDNIWHSGMEIAMVIDKDSTEEFQFAPTLSCQCIQKIVIGKEDGRLVQLSIDGRVLAEVELQQFAVNDGFQNADELYAYFNGSFTGKLIHWTSFKY